MMDNLVTENTSQNNIETIINYDDLSYYPGRQIPDMSENEKIAINEAKELFIQGMNNMRKRELEELLESYEPSENSSSPTSPSR